MGGDECHHCHGNGDGSGVYHVVTHVLRKSDSGGGCMDWGHAGDEEHQGCECHAGHTDVATAVTLVVNVGVVVVGEVVGMVNLFGENGCNDGRPLSGFEASDIGAVVACVIVAGGVAHVIAAVAAAVVVVAVVVVVVVVVGVATPPG